MLRNWFESLQCSLRKDNFLLAELVARCTTGPRRAYSRSHSSVKPNIRTTSSWLLNSLNRVSILAQIRVERYVIGVYIARFKTKSSFVEFVVRLRWYLYFESCIRNLFIYFIKYKISLS